MPSAVEQEIRALIDTHGRITFARFQEMCLYSPRGGFYSTRASGISAHFRTSPTSHPAFGALVARQLEEMWRILGEPPIFHVIEVGSGDGALARSIVSACQGMPSGLADALRYVAADYEPWWPPSPQPSAGAIASVAAEAQAGHQKPARSIERVKTEGLLPFKNVVGCILSNELLDNFPVHRFAIQDGRVKESYVVVQADGFVEVMDEPSTPRIEERLSALELSLPEGFRGEMCLALEPWTDQLAQSLERGFVLTIDYGELAEDLYSLRNAGGTLVCFQQHLLSYDPYQHIGRQDITAVVDFRALMELGEQRGLATVGYALQRDFLANLGFSSYLDALQSLDISYARKELARMALMTLVDVEEQGSFKVLAQAKGLGAGIALQGFKEQGT